MSNSFILTCIEVCESIVGISVVRDVSKFASMI